MTSTDLKSRADVSFFEKLMKMGIQDGELDDIEDECDLTHYFTPINQKYGCGVYARELRMPRGSLIVGKLHAQDHLAFLLEGEVTIISENFKETVKAPHTFVSPVGAKRAFFVHEEALLTTIHLTSEPSADALEVIEEEVIAENYTVLGLEEPDLSQFDLELEKIRNKNNELD